MQTSIWDAKCVSKENLARLFALFAQYYDCVDFDSFERDLTEKDYVLVLRDDFNEIVGFSTLIVISMLVEGEPVKLVFSGDTIIKRSHWGTQELVKAWCSLVGSLKRELFGSKLYWLLISKGYRTYLYLPLFANEFYPRANHKTPDFAKAIMDCFGNLKYPGFYDETKGIISFDESKGQLKPEVSGVPGKQIENEHVQFFLRQNPGYFKGDELVCLAEISTENLKSVALRYFLKGFNFKVKCA